MFNDVFNDFATNKEVDLFPKEIEAEHAKLCDFLYDNVNNGVYKAGFATHQRPYEISCRKLFEALDELEARLSKGRYLFGNPIVEYLADRHQFGQFGYAAKMVCVEMREDEIVDSLEAGDFRSDFENSFRISSAGIAGIDENRFACRRLDQR